ncbi:MAG: NADH-quinone oxidoreductase subunit NuoE, partial [Rhizobiales bacterium]|nr:NADH-quinone oxidoreductase subunit NuoE [Hyphomicrobiales bacterium]
MSVRRLAEKQPASFAFTAENLAWAKDRIAKYPPGRQASAVISLLWRAQEQEGWLTEPAIRVVAEMLDMPKIRVLEVATFYTMFLLEPVGRIAHIQVCGTTPCWLRGAEAIKDICQHRIHHDPHHLSKDGNFSWEEVECLGACVNAPMIQIGADTYEDLTRETFTTILNDLAMGKKPKPGPQNGRQQSAPLGGPTTLTEAPTFTPWVLPRPPEPALTDAQAKKPTEGAGQRETPAPTAPLSPAANAPPPKPTDRPGAAAVGPAAAPATPAAPAAPAEEKVSDDLTPAMLTAARGGQG